MLTIASLRTLNWKCYRGEVVLELRPTSYAIVARHERDPARSNWLGKSSLVEAIDYALWGRLPKSCRSKRDWISRGERRGEVKLFLSNGAEITRTIPSSGSEKLFWNPGSDVVDLEGKLKPLGFAVQDAAQQQIERSVGLTRDDYSATCYFRQREMARLVTCDPGQRMELVAGWIRLAPLQRCEDLAGERLGELTKRRDELDQRIRQSRAAIKEALDSAQCDNAAQLDELIVRLRSEAEACRAAVELARKGLVATVERAHLEQHARRYDAIVEEGKRIVANSTMAPGSAELEAAKATAREFTSDFLVAKEEVRVRSVLVSGRFDGACPLVGDACPARQFVEGGVARNAQRLDESKKRLEVAHAAHEETAHAEQRLLEAARRADQDARRLQDLRDEARRLKPSWSRWQAIREERAEDQAQQRVAFLDEQYREAVRRVGCAESLFEIHERHALLVADLTIQSASLELEIRTAAAAVAVFGKNGAQRRVAEGALAEIERAASDSLADAGIELGVRMTWSREGSGLAATCGKCGSAFPTSQRVKACERCGEERGPNLVNKLDFDVTSRSGGAEDLAGVATQLAAAAWLRTDRMSEWGVAILDEPTSALDGCNRKAFATALPRMLSRAGFAQSFVIAHTTGVLDSMQARIEVVSDGTCSTARIV